MGLESGSLDRLVISLVADLRALKSISDFPDIDLVGGLAAKADPLKRGDTTEKRRLAVDATNKTLDELFGAEKFSDTKLRTEFTGFAGKYLVGGGLRFLNEIYLLSQAEPIDEAQITQKMLAMYKHVLEEFKHHKKLDTKVFHGTAVPAQQATTGAKARAASQGMTLDPATYRQLGIQSSPPHHIAERAGANTFGPVHGGQGRPIRGDGEVDRDEIRSRRRRTGTDV